MATFQDIWEDLKQGKGFRRPYNSKSGSWKSNRFIRYEDGRICFYEKVQIGDRVIERKSDDSQKGRDTIPIQWLFVNDWEPWGD